MVKGDLIKGMVVKGNTRITRRRLIALERAVDHILCGRMVYSLK